MHLGPWEWLLVPWPFIGAGLFLWMLTRQRAPRRDQPPPREHVGPPFPSERDRMTFDQELLCACGDPQLAADDPARVRRIAAELTDGFAALRDVTKAVSIFGSARASRGSDDYAVARRVAAALGREGFGIITGGGPGLMEAANRGARDANVPSIGLTIDLPVEQATNDYVDQVVDFHHFFARKLMFVRYASAFVVLPGGFGTLDELFEALTLVQTHKIADFPIVLVGREHWAGLVDWIDRHVREEGRADVGDLALLHVCDDPTEVSAIVERAYVRQRAARAQSVPEG